VKKLWEREHPHLVSALVRRFTYVVGGVEEEHITLQRNGVQLAVMEKQPLSRNTLGGLEAFTKKGYAKIFACLSRRMIIIALIYFDVD